MFCKHCGAEAAQGDLFCANCGGRIGGGENPGGHEAGAEPLEEGGEGPGGRGAPAKKTVPLWAGVALGVLLVICAVVIAILAGRDKDDVAAAQPTAAPGNTPAAAPETPAPTATPTPTPRMQGGTGIFFGNYDTYLLTLPDLREMEDRPLFIGDMESTILELALQQILARYGYKFTHETWRSYFQGSTGYEPAKEYDEFRLSAMARANCLLMELWLGREKDEDERWKKPVKLATGNALDLDQDGRLETIAFDSGRVFIDANPVIAEPGVVFEPFSKDKSTPFDYIYAGDMDIEAANGLELFIPARNENEELPFTIEVYRYDDGESRYLGHITRSEGSSLSIDGMGNLRGKALYGAIPLRVYDEEVFTFGEGGFARRTADPENAPLYLEPRQNLHCFNDFDWDLTKCASEGDFSEEDAFYKGEYFKLYEARSNIYRYVYTDEAGERTNTEWNLVVYRQGSRYYVLQNGWLYYTYSDRDPIWIERGDLRIDRAFSNLWE